MASSDPQSPATTESRLGRLAAELVELRERLRLGGGPERIERQHAQGKWTARERVAALLDEGSPWLEVGLLVAHDLYDGQAPAAGVVTGVGRVRGREVVVVANDATVKAGSWWPETIRKILRAQEIAMRCRIPIVYLVDSAGVNLPYQGGVFPGQYGAARIFYYNSVMRRYLGVPQLAAVMGPCIAGGAYLPALSDVILMVEGTSFMGLGGPNLVKGATGQVVEAEELGGARVHTSISGVAHYAVPDDEACVAKLRELVAELPPPHPVDLDVDARPGRDPGDLYALLPDDHRQPYDMHAVLECLLDEGHLDEFQPDYAAEMICGTGSIGGITVGVIANARGIVKDHRPGPPRFGGIVYTESAEKVAYFIETMNRHRTPLLFVQDVSGFMVGPDAEHSGIIRAGARFVEAMATATVPKLVLTVNHASGAGYYAMAGQGFDPDFILSLPTGRMGVMEGESAVMALFSAQLERLKAEGKVPDEDLRTRMDEVREDYDRQLDARFAGARGFVDEVVLPEEVRPALLLALSAALRNPGPHLGAFDLGSGGLAPTLGAPAARGGAGSPGGLEDGRGSDEGDA
ncbi:MAG: acyl-CoA carboxylase subunit beta [Gemmatimonadetes bacterium]|nr:MAG: acyl-CoA carboxylase subunit beta [Gemmatimonadota bacterium]